MKTFEQQKREYEYIQKSLPSGSGDPCLDCDRRNNKRVYLNARMGRKDLIMAPNESICEVKKESVADEVVAFVTKLSDMSQYIADRLDDKLMPVMRSLNPQLVTETLYMGYSACIQQTGGQS